MRLSALIAALFASSAAIAAAQPIASEIPPEDPRVAEARAEFERARELAEQRRFDEAAEAFARSLELAPRPSTAFNLGACLYARGRHVEAVVVLERYLAEADPAAEGSGIADAERMLADSRRSVSRLTVEVEPADARVVVDGAPLEGGAARTITLDPGTHVIRAEADGHAPALIELSTRRGETARRAVALEATRLPATLIVEAPEGASVRVDGRPAEGAVELQPGSHSVEVSAPGLAPVTREVDLAWNERVRLAIAPAERARSDLEEPAFWIGALGAGAAVGVAVLIGVLVSTAGSGPDGGTTGVVLTPPAPEARW